MATYRQSHGYYNDGNSHYQSEDRTFDPVLQTITVVRDESFYGQLSRPSIHTSDVYMAHCMSNDESGQLRAILEPLLSTCHKYPYRHEFRYFSDKHMRLIVGRFNKAVDYTRKIKVDDCGLDGLYLVIHLSEGIYQIYADGKGFKVHFYPYESVEFDIPDYRDLAECAMREIDR